MVIYEAPDANVAMAVLMAILAPDHLMETQTCMLYTMKDMIKARMSVAPSARYNLGRWSQAKHG